MENPVAGSAAVTLHCLAVQRYDGVAGSHCSARSACLRLVPGLDRQHDLCAVHNLFPIGQIRFDLNLAADRRIGDVDGEFILLSGGRLRGDCEGVFTRSSVAVDCQLDRAGGLGGQRQVSAVTGAEQADRADLHIAVRVPAGKGQDIGKRVVFQLVTLDGLRSPRLTVRTADGLRCAVRQRILKFKVHVAGIAKRIGKAQILEAAVRFLVPHLHGKRISNRSRAARDLQRRAAVRNSQRLRCTALWGEAGRGNPRLLCVRAGKLQLIVELTEFEVGTADLGARLRIRGAGDALRVGAVFHPDKLQSHILRLLPAQHKDKGHIALFSAAFHCGGERDGICIFSIVRALENQRAGLFQHSIRTGFCAVGDGADNCVLGAFAAQTEAVAQEILADLTVAERTQGAAFGLAAEGGR